MMEDHKKGIFHPGRIWISDSRYYENKGNFRKEVDTYSLARRDSDGTWYCNTCNKVAETEHKNPLCHVCSDWNGCGKDCTLSKVYCSQCGKFLIY
jgi:transposase-like protein